MKVYSNIYTYLSWLRSELWVRRCSDAESVLGRAMSLATEVRIPSDAILAVIASEIERDVQRCREGLSVAPAQPQLQ